MGSVYPYFPDERAIFAALHERHSRQVGRLVETKLMEHAASSLDTLIRASIEAMIDAHAPDPELYELLSREAPHRAEGTRDFSVRLHSAFRLAIASRTDDLTTRRDLDTVAFIVTHMIDALCHAAVLRRPARLSLDEQRTKPSARSWPICTREADQSELGGRRHMWTAPVGKRYFDALIHLVGCGHCEERSNQAIQGPGDG
jgi:AcrR family transcriptional regulator